MKRLVIALVTALLALPAAFVAAPVPPAAAALPPFSAIGDSTLLGMTSSAKAVLNSSYSMLYEAKSCRRLIITSCRGRGVIPPNTLQTMRALSGRLGDAVVIMAGYDDWYNFGGAVDQIVAEARRQGVGRVIWLTYRSQGPYVGIGGAYFATYRQFNAILAAKVREHPELILADWDTYTLGKPSWFAADGIHISASRRHGAGLLPQGPPRLPRACIDATAARRGCRRRRPHRSPSPRPRRAGSRPPTSGSSTRAPTPVTPSTHPWPRGTSPPSRWWRRARCRRAPQRSWSTSPRCRPAERASSPPSRAARRCPWRRTSTSGRREHGRPWPP